MRINDNGENFLKGIANVINAEELLDISSESRGPLFVLAGLNPSLALSKSIWGQPSDICLELIDQLTESKFLTEKVTKELIGTILDSNVPKVANKLYIKFKNVALDSFLKWFKGRGPNYKHERNIIIDEWKVVLKNNPGACLTWLKETTHPNPEAVVLILTILNPLSDEVAKYDSELWIRLINTIDHDLYSENKRILSEFLLPLSFKQNDKHSAKLAEYSFDKINKMLANDELSYKTWSMLAPFLPKLSWYRSWDKCERLRRGMKERGFSFQT